MKNNKLEGSPRRQLWASKRNTIQPKSYNLRPEEMVEVDQLHSDATLPLVIRPRVDGIKLSAWIGHNYDLVQSYLLKFGGILFRGFGLTSDDDFKEVLSCIPVDLMHYMEGATPRTELGNKVYTSTEFPPEQHIAPHNELCYVMTWPMKIWFYCVVPAAKGGQTPITDVRRVFNRLDSRIKNRFMDKGWALVRNFGHRMGLPWQRSFRINEKSELEAYFRQACIEYEWKADDHLKTRQVRPCVSTHPTTGESVWFNHAAFWHVSSLEPELRNMLLESYGEEGLPFNTYYGNGSVIEDEVIAEVREAYRLESTSFLWERGDFLMLDNMLTAHGRFPYEGRRVILTAMGEPYSRA